MLGVPCDPAGLSRLVMSVGNRDFDRALHMVLRNNAHADHVIVFEWECPGVVRLVLDSGSLAGSGREFARKYARGLYTMDPHLAELYALRKGEGVDVLWTDHGVSSVFRRDLLDCFGVSDFAVTGFCDGRATWYTMLLRCDGARFSELDLAAMRGLAAPVNSAVWKHGVLVRRPEPGQPAELSSLFTDYAKNANVAGREYDMCAGILSGHSSDQIAGKLSISVNTVLTYRKRLYQRLGISSQQELFDRVLNAIVRQDRMAS